MSLPGRTSLAPGASDSGYFDRGGAGVDAGWKTQPASTTRPTYCCCSLARRCGHGQDVEPNLGLTGLARRPNV
jgi:hypothetical protein